jgi:hypothetical protein
MSEREYNAVKWINQKLHIDFNMMDLGDQRELVRTLKDTLDTLNKLLSFNEYKAMQFEESIVGLVTDAKPDDSPSGDKIAGIRSDYIAGHSNNGVHTIEDK